MQDRQREGRGLAGAGLGDAEDVAAGQLRGIACAWIGVGASNPARASASVQRRGEAELRESRMSSQVSFPRGGCRCGCRPRQAHVTKTIDLFAMPGAGPLFAPSLGPRPLARVAHHIEVSAALRQALSWCPAMWRSATLLAGRSPGCCRLTRSRYVCNASDLCDAPAVWITPWSQDDSHRHDSVAQIQALRPRCVNPTRLRAGPGALDRGAGGRGAARRGRRARPGDVLVETGFSGISRGTEALVLRGGVPEAERRRMRAPLQAGELPFPGQIWLCGGRAGSWRGRRPLLGREVFVLHPHQDRFAAPAAMAVPLPDGRAAGPGGAGGEHGDGAERRLGCRRGARGPHRGGGRGHGRRAGRLALRPAARGRGHAGRREPRPGGAGRRRSAAASRRRRPCPKTATW